MHLRGRQIALAMVASAWALACAAPRGPSIAQDHVYWCARYLQEGQLRQARIRCELALEYDPSNPEAENLLGVITRHLGQLDAAEEHYKRAIALRSDFAEALNNLGELMVQRGDHEEARQLFEQALGIDPGYVVARQNLATSLSRVDRDAARDQFEKCVELDPSRCACHEGLGVLALEGNEHDTAQVYFERQLTACASDPKAHFNLCFVSLQRQQCAEAIEACNRAVALDPAYAEARAALTEAASCAARHAAAIEGLRQRAAEEPTNPDRRFELGRALEDGGELVDALAEYDAALRLVPRAPLVHLHAARVADRLHITERVLGACSSYLELERESDAIASAWCKGRVRELNAK